MEDAKQAAEDWCEEASRLLEEGYQAADEKLSTILGHIGTGVELRRTLDAASPSGKQEISRRAVARRLLQLRHRAEVLLGDVEPGSPSIQAANGRVKDWIAEARVVLRAIRTNPRQSPMLQALALEGLRGDVEWLGILNARLDRDTPSSHTSWLEVELDRMQGAIGQSIAELRLPDPAFERLDRRCERMRRVLLERRVRREIGWSPSGAAPERLLTERLQLSRLQARIAALPTHGDDEEAPTWRAGDAEMWVADLAVRRADLADLAEAQLVSQGLADSRESCERATQALQDEISETIAFLQDMPLPRAVNRLELAQEDVDRLILTLRRLTLESSEGPGKEPGSDGSDLELEEVLGKQEYRRISLERIDTEVRQLERLGRRLRGEWQEKLLALRLEGLLGRRGVAILENIVLILIAALAGLILGEAVLDRRGGFSKATLAWLAWADLAICTLLLAEFFLKLCLAPRKRLYFFRHFVLDFLASLPFGFISYQLEAVQLEERLTRAADTLRLFRLLRFGRLVQLLRYLRLALPVVRLARVGLFALRLSDRLVRRNAGLLNRNIVLFEPFQAQRPESSEQHRLAAIRSELEQEAGSMAARLDHECRRALATRVLSDLDMRIEYLPDESVAGLSEIRGAREIPVEALVDRLIQLTPERLIDRFGPGFVARADRYLRLLDAPLVRRLPIIRNLVAYREKSPAEAVTLAANYSGHLIQGFLDKVYFLADLQGTLSPPIFLDRLGATIVNATRTPAKRLLWLGSAFLVLFLVVNFLSFLKPFRGFVDRIQALLGWPVIVLGVLCLGFWMLGSWFRKIANQSADYCERVAEAQFAAQTKNLKARRRDRDAMFLAERVIDPELLLRASDDRLPEMYRRHGEGPAPEGTKALFENRELVFLRNVRLLYQDYLDGSPFHRSDTKASVQLLGNLALTNLRRSHLGHLLREGRALDRLDMNRSGGLFGGPYLWFNYITRMIVQETALLLLDYNRHAVPLDRLACSGAETRRAFQHWLSRRMRIEPEDVWLPTPVVNAADANPESSGIPVQPKRREAVAFLETVEFTAIDFLTDDPDRDAVIRGRFGNQVADLVRSDRQQNVRRAFRSFPLHELPLAQRTINPFTFYENYLSRGRIVLFPLIVAGGLAKGVLLALRGVYRGVGEILHPQVDQDREFPADTYWAALRKIHRMRKPVFMGSLWLRARFDVEYLGIPLPTAPPGISADSLMETDLDFVGATRQDRIIAEQIRRGHQRRLEWVTRWLVRFGWTFDELPICLAREIPYLANRGGEAMRALVTACVLDHDDITSLAFSIEGLQRVLAYAGSPGADPSRLPPGLPDPVINLRKLWHPVHRVHRPLSGLFTLPCFPSYDSAQRTRILAYLRRHRRGVRGWCRVVLGQGGDDPWGEVRNRMREVLLRTDLWSDQMLVLRAVQTLTMLDLQHNSDLVWNLGGYTPSKQEEGQGPVDPTPFETRLPASK